MEKRVLNMIISAAGGTAANGAKTYKLALPSSWVAQLGITQEDRQVELHFDGNTITISRPLGANEFAAQKQGLGHDLRKLCYYDGKTLCTTIYADFTDRTLLAENFTPNLTKTAFGRKPSPTWEDFLTFLEERCIPRARAGLREYLETLGLDAYDPLEIIQKTAGRMAEDDQWLEWEALS